MDYLEIAKKNMKIEDLSPKYQDIAQIIGLDNFISMCEYLGGDNLYIPTIKEAVKQHIYNKVRDSKTVMSKKQIAKFYGLSKSTVYKLLRDEDK